MKEPKRGGGRKTKYTPETVEKIVKAVRLGATYALACGYAGISTATFHEWMNKKPEFFDTVKEAEGEGSLKLLARIQQEADSGTWQAAAWILERRYWSEYGRKAITMEHGNSEGKPLEIVVRYERANEDDDDLDE